MPNTPPKKNRPTRELSPRILAVIRRAFKRRLTEQAPPRRREPLMRFRDFVEQPKAGQEVAMKKSRTTPAATPSPALTNRRQDGQVEKVE